MSTANAAVQGIIAYQFNDPSRLTEALQAPGALIIYAGAPALPDGHKRMALLGDTVMKLALLDHWYGGGGSRGNSSLWDSINWPGLSCSQGLVTPSYSLKPATPTSA